MNVRISVGFHCNDVKIIDTIDREKVRQTVSHSSWRTPDNYLRRLTSLLVNLP